MKKTLYSVIFSFCAFTVFAQPSMGLVGHWDMNGTANDVSGNGHDGHGNNLTPAPGSDGVMGHAWYFNGINSSISIPYSPAFNVSNYSIVARFNVKGFYAGPCHYNMIFMRGHSPGGLGGDYFYLAFSDAPAGLGCSGPLDSSLEAISTIAYSSAMWMGPTDISSFDYTPHISKDVWYTVVATFNDTAYKIYVNNVLKSTSVITTPGVPMATGTDSAYIGFDMIDASIGYPYTFKGYIDDIALYNRVLSDSEIVQFSDSCGSVSLEPASVTVPVGGTATYNIGATITGATYRWQQNSGSGFVNLANGGQYSGVTTNTLTVTGVTASMNGYLYKCQVANHLDMPCSDASSAASLTVSSLGVNDITATDFIALYPNPAHAQLTIITSGSGTDLTINNPLGQAVYKTKIDGEQVTIDIADLPAGVYFIQLTTEQGQRAVRRFVKE